MKKLEYGYFAIYHHFARYSYFPDSLDVRLKAMYLLAISAGGWVLLLQTVYLKFFRFAWFSSHPVAMFFALTVYGTLTFMFHRIFIVKEYDQRIFSKYESQWNNNPNKKRDLLLVSFIAALPYLALITIKLLTAE